MYMTEFDFLKIIVNRSYLILFSYFFPTQTYKSEFCERKQKNLMEL